MQTFLSNLYPTLILASPFIIWMIVMIVLCVSTPKENPGRRKTFRVLAIVAGSITVTLIAVSIAFCYMLTVALSHM